MSEVVEEQDKIEAFAAQIERSDLFSIVIEGKDDLLVYTEFEQIYLCTRQISQNPYPIRILPS